jgi:hypothetical protein
VFHVKQLRNLSQRPELVVGGDQTATIVADAASPQTQVGLGALVSARIVTALPSNKNGPVKLASALALHDGALCYLADPDGNLLGERNAIWVHRLVTAVTTPNTRRL